LYSRDDILRAFVNKMYATYGYLDLNDEKTIQFVNQRIMRVVDSYLLPHIGITPDFRDEKAIFITHLIRRLFMAMKMGRKMVNRLTSQKLHVKNQMN
jgi:hypothetical protein